MTEILLGALYFYAIYLGIGTVFAMWLAHRLDKRFGSVNLREMVKDVKRMSGEEWEHIGGEVWTWWLLVILAWPYFVIRLVVDR